MRKEELKAAFDQIEPSPDAENKMLNEIMRQKDIRRVKTVNKLNIKRLLPVLGLVIVIAGGLLIQNLLQGQNYGWPGGEIQTDDLGGREDMVAPVTNQFQLGDRHYIILREELREEFGLPAQISDGDIGEKIADIDNTPDESLAGKEVFQYIPADGEAVLAVKREGDYQLFIFFTFESYNKNQDEDASAYLKLYGINGPQDIQKVQFVEYTEQSKIEDRLNIVGELTESKDIEQFYGYYSVLKNASDKYFRSLLGELPGGLDVTADPAEPVPDKDYEQNVTDGGPAPDNTQEQGTRDIGEREPAAGDDPQDLPAQASDNTDAVIDVPGNPDDSVSKGSSSTSAPSGMMDMGDSGSQDKVVASSQGSAGDALANPIGVRIYNKNGVYYETMYYPNISFLSRYEVSDDFRDFINKHIK